MGNILTAVANDIKKIYIGICKFNGTSKFGAGRYKKDLRIT